MLYKDEKALEVTDIEAQFHLHKMNHKTSTIVHVFSSVTGIIIIIIIAAVICKFWTCGTNAQVPPNASTSFQVPSFSPRFIWDHIIHMSDLATSVDSTVRRILSRFCVFEFSCDFFYFLGIFNHTEKSVPVFRFILHLCFYSFWRYLLTLRRLLSLFLFSTHLCNLFHSFFAAFISLTDNFIPVSRFFPQCVFSIFCGVLKFSRFINHGQHHVAEVLMKTSDNIMLIMPCPKDVFNPLDSLHSKGPFILTKVVSPESIP